MVMDEFGLNGKKVFIDLRKKSIGSICPLFMNDILLPQKEKMYFTILYDDEISGFHLPCFSHIVSTKEAGGFISNSSISILRSDLDPSTKVVSEFLEIIAPQTLDNIYQPSFI